MWPFRFCPNCGQPLDPPSGRHEQHCHACGDTQYHNAKPCAGVLITRDGRVLLARRAHEPHQGTWDVVGGFLHPHEHPENGARREAKEETGLDIRLGDLLAVYMDRYGDNGDCTLNLYYIAEAPAGDVVAASDASELRWFSPDELPTDVAFEHQIELLEKWTRHVRARQNHI
jgi:ADP-ribose pyrophosphatase YjhB (NUDIX family)